MVAPLTKALASIEEVRAPARADPASLSKALAYWDALRSVNGEDFRSGARLLDALRTVACTHPEGAYEFACAYFELADLSGDVPELDEPLRMALSNAVPVLPLEKAVVVERLVTPATMWQHDDL
jgi:hypothetical protein